MLTRRRANRLPVRRYAGGYVLTELVRCACGGRMAGTLSGSLWPTPGPCRSP
jgi:hypothetical protein